MRNWFKLIVWISSLSILLTGCWDRKELTDIALVVAIGIDKNKKEGEKYLVTFQMVNPGEVAPSGGTGGGGGRQSTVTTFQTSGKSIFEAVRKITTKASRKIFFGHNQLMVIGGEIAREGVEDLFDFIERDYEVRTDFYVLVTKEVAAFDILSTMAPMEKIPAVRLKNQVEALESAWGTGYGITVHEFIQALSSQGRHPVAGIVHLHGDTKAGAGKENVEKIVPDSLLELGNMAAFHEGKLVGYLSARESRGLAWTQDKIKNTVVHIPCGKEELISMEVIRSSTDMKAEIKQGNPHIQIRIEQEANIGEVTCADIDVAKDEVFVELEQKLEQEIKSEIEAVLQKAQKELQADIFGFGELVYKTAPAYWESNKKNWDQLFSDVTVTIEVNAKLRREGMRSKSYLENVRKRMENE